LATWAAGLSASGFVGIAGSRGEGDDGGLFPAAAAAEEGEGRG